MGSGQPNSPTTTYLACPHCGAQHPSELSYCPDCGGPYRIGKYLVRKLVGKGGMGTVYLGHHPELDRAVAIKVMNADAIAEAGAVERFRREAQLVGRLNHPGVVRIYDVVSQGDFLFLVMEWVEGYSLDALVRCGKITIPEAVRVTRSLAETLAHAHDQGIIHRDIKPSNIHLDKDGQPRLLDFGLAKLLGARGGTLTQTGQIVGTPAYLAPEVISEPPERIGPAVDIYGLGAVLYEMLTSAPPYQGPSAMSVLRRVELEEPAPVERANPGAPPSLVAVVKRAMARDPAHRFPDMRALAQALAELPPLVTPPGRTQTLPWVGAAVGTALALTLTMIVFWRAFGSEESDSVEEGASNPPIPEQTSTSPPSLESLLDADEDRRDRLESWLATTNPPQDAASQASRAEAHIYLGCYREARRLAEEMEDDETASLAQFYGEVMPLLLCPDPELALGEAGPGFTARRTIHELVGNLRTKNFEAAGDILDRIPDEEIGPHDRATLGAFLALRAGDTAGAKTRFDEAEEADPEYPPYLWLAAASAALTGQRKLQEAYTNQWSGVVAPGTLDERFALATLTLLSPPGEKTDWAGAAEILRQSDRESLRADPASSLLAAVVYFKEHAETQLFTPPDPEFWGTLLDLARTQDHVGGHLARAGILAAHGTLEDAKAELQVFMERHPSWEEDWQLLGDWYWPVVATRDGSAVLDPLLALSRVPYVEMSEARQILDHSVSSFEAVPGMEEALKAVLPVRAGLLFLAGEPSPAIADLDRLVTLGFSKADLSAHPQLQGGWNYPEFQEWVNDSE